MIKANLTKHPWRWTKGRAAIEFGADVSKIRKGLAHHQIEPGPDGRYSTAQMFLAIYGNPNSIERRAREARFQQIIDEAEETHAELAALRNKLFKVEMVKDF